MSKFTHICCAICGRDLYKSFISTDDDTIRHIDFYSINTVDGEEQICPSCYDAKMIKHFELKKTVTRYKFDRNHSCLNCRNRGSHNGVCDICKNYNCWTEPNNKQKGQ